MRNPLSKRGELRDLIRETIRRELTEDQKELLKENQRESLVRELKQLQRQYGDEKAISAFLEDFNVGRIKTAISQARQTLQREQSSKRSKPFRR